MGFEIYHKSRSISTNIQKDFLFSQPQLGAEGAGEQKNVSATGLITMAQTPEAGGCSVGKPKGSEFYFFLQNSLMSSWTHDLSGPVSASGKDYNTGTAQKASGGWREIVDTMPPPQLTQSRCSPLATHSSSYQKGWPVGTRKVPREIKCKVVFSQAHPLALNSAKTWP